MEKLEMKSKNQIMNEEEFESECTLLEESIIENMYNHMKSIEGVEGSELANEVHETCVPPVLMHILAEHFILYFYNGKERSINDWARVFKAVVKEQLTQRRGAEA
tara:strand:+ start:2389 stop:2703 length:315 start_codon:yes stop_codon:yes gene_type:complete